MAAGESVEEEESVESVEPAGESTGARGACVGALNASPAQPVEATTAKRAIDPRNFTDDTSSRSVSSSYSDTLDSITRRGMAPASSGPAAIGFAEPPL